jgi:hypothetical protein
MGELDAPAFACIRLSPSGDFFLSPCPGFRVVSGVPFGRPNEISLSIHGLGREGVGERKNLRFLPKKRSQAHSAAWQLFASGALAQKSTFGIVFYLPDF